jgi:hypothetical protein
MAEQMLFVNSVPGVSAVHPFSLMIQINRRA